jgi:intein-encoded DNA endonuclease-like protein
VDVNLCKNRGAFAELLDSGKYDLVRKFEDGRGSAVFKRKDIKLLETINVDYTKFLQCPTDFWLL